MKMTILYLGLLILLLVGASNENTELEIISILGLLCISLFYIIIFRGHFPANSHLSSPDQVTLNSSLDQENHNNGNSSPVDLGTHSSDHSGHHDFGGGWDSSSWSDSSGTGDSGHSH